MTNVLHIVLLTWSPDTPELVKSAAKEKILDFPARIPGILSVAVGTNVSPEDLGEGLDYGFLITFEDAVARDAYLPHPVHIELAELLLAHSSRVVVYDLESRSSV